MPRGASTSVDDIVKSAIEGVVKRTAVAIAKSIADQVAERLEVELRKAAGPGARGRVGRPRVARPRAELTRWVADRRARRVPNFVIEQTSLKTKKAIVAKYGENAAFEKGKPAPKAK
jgi:hypothetical protein